ncbi:MAG: hypothetical protein IJW82_02400, partial [Clostridia bacterium]|nr:hypothetical protein [Clostridia bacterium]
MGIKYNKNNILIDPILPESFNETCLKIKINNKIIKFNYYIKNDNSRIKKVVIGNKEFLEKENMKYRTGGIKFSINEIKNNTEINIYCE